MPDALGYYRAALAYRDEHADPTALAHLETLVRQHSTHYDLIYRTTVELTIPLGDNKTRDNDSEFRALADHHVKRVLHELELPHQLLPADGHDQALSQAVTFITARLAGPQAV
ncbi:MAG: hypothetical protein M3Z25_16595 [Actinomycetota bacterium]|nr:hypothetical protein [Actinomycetota bacterium]